MLWLESTPQIAKEGVFVLIGIALLVVLYFVLSALKAKRTPPPCEQIPEEVPEEEPESTDAFRPVAFVRTNKRAVAPEVPEKEEKNAQEESDL